MIRYQSTTLLKGAVARFSIAAGALIAAMLYLASELPKGHAHESLFLTLLVAAMVIGFLIARAIFLTNVTAVWKISEEGIAESICPRWKWLPFGVYRERWVPWDQVASVDASNTVGSILGQEKKHFVVRLSQGDALRIYQLGSDLRARRGRPVGEGLWHLFSGPPFRVDRPSPCE